MVEKLIRDFGKVRGVFNGWCLGFVKEVWDLQSLDLCFSCKDKLERDGIRSI